MDKMDAMNCSWPGLFDDLDKDHLEAGLLSIGVLSTLTGLWLNGGMFMTTIVLDRSYRNFANFTLASCFRGLAALNGRFTLSSFFKGSKWEPFGCKLLAFIETFMAVYETECLTHVAIERYVVAKYNSYEWRININHYKLFHNLSLSFATLYSVLPLFGVGQYAYDFTCNSCTYDMVLPDSNMRYVIVAIFFLRSIKPAVVIIVLLIWAVLLERNYANTAELNRQKQFTKTIIMVSFVNLASWTPIALIRGNYILSQLIDIELNLASNVNYIKRALWIQWLAPAITNAMLFYSDDKIQNNMITPLSPQYNIEDDDDYEDKNV